MTPKAKRRKRISLTDRFWPKVGIRGDDECWEWQGSRSQDGYGKILAYSSEDNRKLVCAHRVSWQIHNGPIPEGLWVLHKCDNPPCVNPNHLFLGTSDDNFADMRAKGRQARGMQTGSAKLSDNEVLEIRRIREEVGFSYQRIADMFSVGTTTVEKIINRTRWRHL